MWGGREEKGMVLCLFEIEGVGYHWLWYPNPTYTISLVRWCKGMDFTINMRKGR